MKLLQKYMQESKPSKKALYAKEKAEQEALSTVYTVLEVAKRLKCGKTKAYELLELYTQGREGGLRHQRIGSKYIISEQAVREWLGDLPALGR